MPPCLVCLRGAGMGLLTPASAPVASLPVAGGRDFAATLC